MKFLITTALTVIMVACGGESSSEDVEKGLKIIVTERAQAASDDGLNSFIDPSFASFNFSPDGQYFTQNYRSTLSSFRTAFNPGDTAKFTVTGVETTEVYEDGSTSMTYMTDEVTKTILSIENNTAIYNQHTKSCFTRSDCTTESEEFEYSKADYQADIRKIFNVRLFVQELKKQGKSGTLVIDLLDEDRVISSSIGGDLITLAFSMVGEVDGEKIDGEVTLVFDPDLPFVANPIYTKFEQGTEDSVPQISTLKSYNGNSILVQ